MSLSLAGMVLESLDDVAPLVSCRSSSLYCLCLPLTRLVLNSRLSVQHCPVVVASLACCAHAQYAAIPSMEG